MRLSVLAVMFATVCAPGCHRVFGLDFHDDDGDAGQHAPWLADYSYRKPITITANPSMPLVNFPVSIAFDADPDLAAHARSDGLDLVLTDADNQPLPSELVAYDPATGALDAWVEVPALPGTSSLFLYYGGPARPTSPAAAWSDRFAAVWHMSGNAAAERDSTRNMHDALGPTSPGRVPGIAGAARSYGASDYLNVASGDGSLNFDQRSFAFSAWVYVDGSNTSFDCPLFKGGTSPGIAGYAFLLGTGPWQVNISAGNGDVMARLGDESALLHRWVFIAGVVDRDPAVLKFLGLTNGAVSDTQPIGALGSVTSPYDLQLGISASYPFTGLLDEVRIYNEAPPAAWFAAEYANLHERSTFLFVDAEQPY